MTKPKPQVTYIEYIRPEGFWAISLGEEGGQLGVCTCELLCYATIRELARKRFNTVLEPMTQCEWLALCNELVFARYEAPFAPYAARLKAGSRDA